MRMGAKLRPAPPTTLASRKPPTARRYRIACWMRQSATQSSTPRRMSRRAALRPDRFCPAAATRAPDRRSKPPSARRNQRSPRWPCRTRSYVVAAKSREPRASAESRSHCVRLATRSLRRASAPTHRRWRRRRPATRPIAHRRRVASSCRRPGSRRKSASAPAHCSSPRWPELPRRQPSYDLSSLPRRGRARKRRFDRRDRRAAKRIDLRPSPRTRAARTKPHRPIGQKHAWREDWERERRASSACRPLQ